MSTYKLKLSFTSEQLKAFYAAGSNIAVAKPSQENVGPNVIWQVIRPMPEVEVEWNEEYGIYASTAAISNGAVLRKMSKSGFPAAGGKGYVLGPEGVFEASGPEGEKDSFYGTNHFPEDLTFGLYQDAIVGGKRVAGNAISAAPLLRGSTAQMTPYTTVYVWLQSQVASNTVVTRVTSPQEKVLFGGGQNEASLTYDSASGTLVVGGGAKSGVEVESLVPATF